ncbi:hypothetical protein ACQ4PT_024141 [Festuca glaucescens]
MTKLGSKKIAAASSSAAVAVAAGKNKRGGASASAAANVGAAGADTLKKVQGDWVKSTVKAQHLEYLREEGLLPPAEQLAGHPAPSCLPPLPEGGSTFEVELPEVEPIDTEDSLPSANTSPTESVGDSEEEEVDEAPLTKRPRRERTSSVVEASAPEKAELRDDGDSGSLSPGVKEPAMIEPISMAPPVGGKASFGTFIRLDDYSEEEDTSLGHDASLPPSPAREHVPTPSFQELEQTPPDAAIMATATEVATPSTSAGPSSSTASRLENHPFYRTLVDSAAAYVRVESDHEAVAQRVKEIERERDQAQRKLKEAEDRENATRQSDRVQVERLLGLAHVVGDAFGTPPPELVGEDVPLERAVSLFYSLCAGAKDALSKTTGALAAVHKSVFPQLAPPASADGLAAAFGPESSTMASFGRAQTVRGSEITFQLLLGHGVATDLKKVVADFPRKPGGKVIKLGAVKEEAAKLAEDMMSMSTALLDFFVGVQPPSVLSGVNPDKMAEETRIHERLDDIIEDTSCGKRYFWSDRVKARVLALLLDRSWRAVLLLESCRGTLAKVHRAMFPHNEQPQGLPALLSRFQDGEAIQKMLRAQLVGGANMAFAYLRMHWSNFNFEGATNGLLEKEHYTSTLGWARKVIRQVQDQTEELVGPLDGAKKEPVDR